MNILNNCLVLFVLWINIVKSNKIPWNETLTEAVIVPQEDKDKAKGVKEKHSLRYFSKLWTVGKEDNDVILLGQVLEDIEKGRGKSHKYKKFTKFMYPLFMGVLIAKIVLIPLILKMLTAISASALVMSKIALITTGFLALKWIFAGTVHDGKDRFEIIYLPTTSNGKPYRSATGGFSLWDDQSWSDSNVQYAVASPAAGAAGAAVTASQQKYIPVNIKQYELPYNSYYRPGGGSISKKGLNNAVNDLYYYSQHNYNNANNEGKPFL